jgi:hypothetical protein
MAQVVGSGRPVIRNEGTGAARAIRFTLDGRPFAEHDWIPRNQDEATELEPGGEAAYLLATPTNGRGDARMGRPLRGTGHLDVAAEPVTLTVPLLPGWGDPGPSEWQKHYGRPRLRWLVEGAEELPVRVLVQLRNGGRPSPVFPRSDRIRFVGLADDAPAVRVRSEAVHQGASRAERAAVPGVGAALSAARAGLPRLGCADGGVVARGSAQRT